MKVITITKEDRDKINTEEDLKEMLKYKLKEAKEEIKGQIEDMKVKEIS